MPVILNDEAVFKEKLYSNFMKKKKILHSFSLQFAINQVKSSHPRLYSAFNNECRFFQSSFTEINL